MAQAREAILETTARLLETQGYHATGLNQIVAESGAPKGSLYYYFPDGKEGLTEEVITRINQTISQRISDHLAAEGDPVAAIYSFLLALARYVEASSCRGGGPIASVALETATSSPRLRAACESAYQNWQELFAAKLRSGAFSPARAQRLAVCIIAAIEGAIILCRTQGSATPVREVAEEMRLLLLGAQHHEA
ncbi:MAG: TetR/AcrR family transcriptional regulator [Chloroflexaceae bacterium]|jgi:TetR/AcrR family transcriptional repressor of lmrAB and yxaGH operons|nr:TetR/AcrR family transcriptional regulator [Chloroflexaceae bacterium]